MPRSTIRIGSAAAICSLAAGKILAMDVRIDLASTAAPPDLCDVVDLAGARLVPGPRRRARPPDRGRRRIRAGLAGPARRRSPPCPAGGITTLRRRPRHRRHDPDVAALVATRSPSGKQGLSAWCWTGSYEVPPITLTGTVRSDIVFVDPILGVGEVAISDHRSSQPTFDEIARLAADCHVAGLMSGKAGILHLHLGDGARGLALVRRALDETELPRAIFYPTHVNRKKRLFAEALELARRGCTVDVTAFPVEDGEDAFAAPDAIERYLDDGAPPERLTCSSDGGGCLPTFGPDGRLVAMDVGRPGAVPETLQTLLTRGHALEVVSCIDFNSLKV